jgi:hypothetical protein
MKFVRPRGVAMAAKGNGGREVRAGASEGKQREANQLCTALQLAEQSTEDPARAEQGRTLPIARRRGSSAPRCSPLYPLCTVLSACFRVASHLHAAGLTISLWADLLRLCEALHGGERAVAASAIRVAMSWSALLCALD